MRILYIAHRIPYPPNKGEKIRAFNQIKHLSRNHEIHLACLVDEKEDLQYIPSLRDYCASVEAVYRNTNLDIFKMAWALVTGKPLSVVAFHSPELKRRITAVLDTGKIDVIMVYSSAMAEYVRDVENVPRVMDFVDADSEKWRLFARYHRIPQSLIYRIEATRLARFEALVAGTFEHTILVSENEAAIIRMQAPGRPVSAVSNGVDLEYFSPTGRPARSKDPVIVFTGAMDYFPNVDAVQFFCTDIFPIVRKAVPEARFLIVGRKPSRAVRKLEKVRNVTVTGSVPDVRKYLRTARVSVAPFRLARGIQNKVLEAMAMGVPVVSTNCAAEGIDASSGSDLLVTDYPDEFARCVIDVLKDDRCHRELSGNGRKRVEDGYTWERWMRTLEDILMTIGGKTREPGP